MSEDVNQVADNQDPVTTDPFEEKATPKGWRPITEWEGDPEEWIDAKEFVKRAPLYEKNHKLKKEVNDLKSTIHEVKGYISTVADASYKRAMADLTAQRDAAIEDGDKEQVREIDKAMKDAESIKAPIDNVHPSIREWERENGEWFYADQEISGFGMAYATNYLNSHPNDFDGALKAMEGAVKKAFPDKFTPKSDKKNSPPAVEAGGKTPTGTKTYTKADLGEEARKVMTKFVRQGLMTEEEYIKGLVDSGAIGGKK
jgi:polyhydroxyalkanoate synthesis regulator phasin